MLKALLTVQLAGLKHQLFSNGKQTRQASTGKRIGMGILMVILVAYLFVVFGGLFLLYFGIMAQPFHDAGLSWLYFALLLILAFALMFIGTVFAAKAQLFEPKDTDLLLSMPIRPSAILVSRLLSLLLINYVLELVVVVGAGIAWFRRFTLPPLGLAAFVLILLLLPLLSLALSALFAWLLSLATRRLRRKSLFSLLLSLVMMLGYMYVMFQLNDYINQIIAQMDAIAAALGSLAPLYWMGGAMVTGDPVQLLLSLAVLIIPFVIACWILSATFIKTATSQQSVAKIRYVERDRPVRTPFRALLAKEAQRLVSSSTYMLNAGLGLVFLVIGAGALLVKGTDIRALLFTEPAAALFGQGALLLLFGLMNAMTLITAPSVSLEGRSIWIPQSMPLSPRLPLQAKLALQLVLGLPVSLFFTLALVVALRPTGWMLLNTLLLPQIYTVLSAVLGLSLNLRFPNLTWRNEAQVMKSGAAIILTMLLGWAAALLGGLSLVLALLLLPAFVGPILLVYSLLLALVTALLYRWCMTGGVRRFAQMG